MFPWTVPSEKSSGDQAELRVFVIVPSGSQVRWVDYIPVSAVTPTTNDSYDTAGAIRVEEIEDATGLVAWVDYVPVSEDAAEASGKWRFDANGWIPVSGMNA